MPEEAVETKLAGDLPSRGVLAIAALLAADRDERAEGQTPRRSEFVLSDAGFTYQEIAALTGKKSEAVRSAVRRAKSKPTGVKKASK